MEKNSNNIILIGLPGAGKSTIGRSLSFQLGMGYVDTDKLISLAIDDTLQNYIDKYGSEEFKKIEEEIISTLDISNSIISTGGSVVYSEKSMSNLKNLGTIIYLDVPNNKIVERIALNPNRGIVMKNGQTLEEVLNERLPLYEKWADIKFHNISKSSYMGAINLKKEILKIIAK